MEAGSRHRAGDQGDRAAVASRLGWWASLLIIPGGVLWALSPLGIRLSELKFKSPEVFWKLFPSAPALLALGLIGLFLWRPGGDNRLMVHAGFWTALAGAVLIAVGDIGLYYLDLDSTYIMSAPAYRLFRVGLAVFSLGSLVFVLAALRAGTLSLLAAFPLVAGSLGGLFCSIQDLSALGVALWTFFGLGWAWAGCVLLADGLWPTLARLVRGRAAAGK